jgi:predicted DNA-binding protein
MKSYTPAVKTAVSLPDELFERAERIAQRLGRSRSALYAEALAAYLETLEGDDEVTAALDAIHHGAGEAAASLPGAGFGRALIDAGDWEW